VTASTPQARGEPVLDLVPAISMGGELVLELQRLHTRGAGARGDGHAPWGVQPCGLTNFLNGILEKEKKARNVTVFLTQKPKFSRFGARASPARPIGEPQPGGENSLVSKVRRPESRARPGGDADLGGGERMY